MSTTAPMSVAVDRLVVGGAACIVAGGLVAAVTRPLGIEKGSWLAAYLVLVCGVALIAIAVAQQRLPEPIPAGVQTVQAVGWVGANVTIVAGSMADAPIVVDVGSIVLLAVLVLTARTGWPLTRTRHLFAYVYLAILAVLAVSVPVGMVLAHAD